MFQDPITGTSKPASMMCCRILRLMSSEYGGMKQILFALKARKAAKVASMGVVQATSGRASRIRAWTLSAPMTIPPEVQP